MHQRINIFFCLRKVEIDREIFKKNWSLEGLCSNVISFSWISRELLRTCTNKQIRFFVSTWYIVLLKIVIVSLPLHTLHQVDILISGVSCLYKLRLLYNSVVARHSCFCLQSTAATTWVRHTPFEGALELLSTMWYTDSSRWYLSAVLWRLSYSLNTWQR